MMRWSREEPAGVCVPGAPSHLLPGLPKREGSEILLWRPPTAVHPLELRLAVLLCIGGADLASDAVQPAASGVHFAVVSLARNAPRRQSCSRLTARFLG
jgi:hypothetical protein